MSSTNERFTYDAARLNEIVERVLRVGIASGEIPGSVILQEARLAAQFELSRAPIQQALRRLEGDGLVCKIGGLGYVVGAMPVGATKFRIYPEIAIPVEAVEALRVRGGWEKIYRQVEHDILSVMPFGRYHVVERALAESYGVSRTVTRDVLSRLEERGLLEKEQRSHWAVPQLTAQLMKDLYEVRRLLEPAALLDAAGFISLDKVAAMRDRLRAAEARYPNVTIEELSGFEQDLHVELLGLCRNRRLLAAMRQSQSLLVATTYLFQRYLGVPHDEPFLVEHRLVLEHLLVGSPTAAVAALEGHMVSALDKGLKRLEFLAKLDRPPPPAFLRLVV